MCGDLASDIVKDFSKIELKVGKLVRRSGRSFDHFLAAVEYHLYVVARVSELLIQIVGVSVQRIVT
jgi:hypothetical protein